MAMASDLRTETGGFESHKGILLLYYFLHGGFDNAHIVIEFPAFHTS